MNNRPRLEVPHELTKLLLDFTVSILLENPSDLVDFACKYFKKLQESRNNNESSPPSVTSENEELDEEDDDDELFEPPPVQRNDKFRRKSVWAEQYDPEADDDDDDKQVIYPKSDEERSQLAEAVKNILLFKALDANQFQEVLDAMFEKKVQPGDDIIKQGDDGDNFYIIRSGTYDIYVNGNKVGQYENQGSFGELALLYNQPRAATITAVTDGSVWGMDRLTFRRIVVKSSFKKRQKYEALLDSVPLLETLVKYEKMNLCDALMPKTFTDGQCILKQGAPANGMYFIEDGVCRITINKDGKEVEVTQLKKGEYFGELALVTKKPRAANAYAVGNVNLAFLDVAAFERLLGPCMSIMNRNVDHYKKQVVELFGSEANISELR